MSHFGHTRTATPVPYLRRLQPTHFSYDCIFYPNLTEICSQRYNWQSTSIGSDYSLAPTSHYLNQWWPSFLTHICVSRPQCQFRPLWLISWLDAALSVYNNNDNDNNTSISYDNVPTTSPWNRTAITENKFRLYMYNPSVFVDGVI